MANYKFQNLVKFALLQHFMDSVVWFHPYMGHFFIGLMIFSLVRCVKKMSKWVYLHMNSISSLNNS